MEARDQRIGEIMVEMCYICPDHLQIALELQETRRRNGRKHIHIGEIMVSEGFITRSQLKRALEEQKKRGDVL